MKIVFLSASGQLGGAERVLLDLLAGLRKARPEWRLEVILSEEGPLLLALMQCAIEVSVLPFPEKLAALGDSGARGLRGRIRLAATAAMALPQVVRYRNQLRERLARSAPDIVHSNGFKMHVLSAVALPVAARLVWHLHDFVGRRALMRGLLRRYSKVPFAIVCVSRAVAEDARGVMLRPQRVHVVLNAVDLDRFSPSGPVTDLGAPRDGAVCIGIVATFAKWKGHEVFLRALAALPNHLRYRAFVIGADVYRTGGSQYSAEQLAAMARALGLAERVTFTGFLPDTAAAMRGLDIVVHASTAPEPFGLAIAEGMACGRAVIASMGGGATEILTPGVDGLGHPPGNVVQLGRCIERLIEHPELRRVYGARARKTAESLFQLERQVQQLIAIYTAA